MCMCACVCVCVCVCACTVVVEQPLKVPEIKEACDDCLFGSSIVCMGKLTTMGNRPAQTRDQ